MTRDREEQIAHALGRMSTRVLRPIEHSQMDVVANTRWVVLVEGPSDQAAVETLARRLGRDLTAEDVQVMSIGGAHAIGRFLRDLPDGVRSAGLCDVGELVPFGRALERRGVGPAGTREDLEALGFFVCEPDLEGELIRALGAAGVETVLETSGKLSSFRTFQKQPQWHHRPIEAQLRRFFGSSAGKIRHAPLMVEALDLDRVPRPLDLLLAHVGTHTDSRQ
jgi:Overcoming lysogenization defect protein-like, TOPRIM domain